MTETSKFTVIALEEHYWDPDLVAMFPGREGKRVSDVERRLLDMGELRLREMDEAGIDVQVLSHGAPGTQKLDAETSKRLARQTNDRLAAFIATNPSRFSALALLPTPDPVAAADELERAVTRLNFKGAMVHGLTNGKFLDEKQFWPIFAKAEELDVPIYLHPSFPHPGVIDAYYRDYAAAFPELIGPALGFTVEAATQAIRLVISGVFIRMVRVNMLQTLRSDYVESARARGVNERHVVYRHAFRNALIPVVTIMGLQFSLLLGGAVLTETTFSWPGLGSALVDFLNARDYAAVQGIVTFFAVIVIVVSLAIDIINGLIDPRVRY